jgi:hypothetical protein
MYIIANYSLQFPGMQDKSAPLLPWVQFFRRKEPAYFVNGHLALSLINNQSRYFP